MKRFSSVLIAISCTLLIGILATVISIFVKLHYTDKAIPPKPDPEYKEFTYSVEPPLKNIPNAVMVDKTITHKCEAHAVTM